MNFIEIVAQIFGIAGLLFSAYSFQKNKNKSFFVMQALSGLMFFMNFILIGSVAAALFNLMNVVRGVLLAKNNKKILRLMLIEMLYTACFVFSLTMIYNDILQVILSSGTFATLIIMTVFMWKGNGRHIRYAQVFMSSPVWLIHNIFNFSLGGILCEAFAMSSVIISFVRYGKDGFEK